MLPQDGRIARKSSDTDATDALRELELRCYRAKKINSRESDLRIDMELCQKESLERCM